MPGLWNGTGSSWRLTPGQVSSWDESSWVAAWCTLVLQGHRSASGDWFKARLFASLLCDLVSYFISLYLSFLIWLGQRLHEITCVKGSAQCLAHRRCLVISELLLLIPSERGEGWLAGFPRHTSYNSSGLSPGGPMALGLFTRPKSSRTMWQQNSLWLVPKELRLVEKGNPDTDAEISLFLLYLLAVSSFSLLVIEPHVLKVTLIPRRIENRCSNKTYTQIFIASLVTEGKKRKKTQLLTDRRTGKANVVYPHSGILLSHKNRRRYWHAL